MGEKSRVALIGAIATVVGITVSTLGGRFVVPPPEPEAEAALATVKAAYEALKKAHDARTARLNEMAEAQARTRGLLEGLRWHVEQVEKRLARPWRRAAGGEGAKAFQRKR